jgi:hypothetical protein
MEMTIWINGRTLTTDAVSLLYEEIVGLAGGRPGDTVVWWLGQQGGTICRGGGIDLKDGMRFAVGNTGRA